MWANTHQPSPFAWGKAPYEHCRGLPPSWGWVSLSLSHTHTRRGGVGPPWHVQGSWSGLLLQHSLSPGFDMAGSHREINPASRARTGDRSRVTHWRPTHAGSNRVCGLHPAMSTVALPPVVTPEGHCCPRFWLAADPCTAGWVRPLGRDPQSSWSVLSFVRCVGEESHTQARGGRSFTITSTTTCSWQGHITPQRSFNTV